MTRLQQIAAKQQIEREIEKKLATGKFTNTGEKYTSEQAIKDASNSALRMTASVNANGSLEWK